MRKLILLALAAVAGGDLRDSSTSRAGGITVTR
jgi:hypothetical protein